MAIKFDITAPFVLFFSGLQRLEQSVGVFGEGGGKKEKEKCEFENR